jgi:hypothetical protein
MLPLPTRFQVTGTYSFRIRNMTLVMAGEKLTALQRIWGGELLASIHSPVRLPQGLPFPRISLTFPQPTCEEQGLIGRKK